MMRYLTILIAALATIACSPAALSQGEGSVAKHAKSVGVNTHEASMTAAMEFLLKAAAADFHAHPPAENLRFHNVRIGYAVTSDGSRRHMLCGEFSSGRDSARSERMGFVTIESPGGPNGYQQLLGGDGLCDDPSATFGIAGDLSPSLQSRFDHL